MIKRLAICAALIVMFGCKTTETRINDLSGLQPDLWTAVFDGKSMGGWKPFVESKYGEVGGPVTLGDKAILMKAGDPYSAVTWDGKLPTINYEFEITAMRTGGADIFCGVLFPVGTNQCSLILGGWGNNVTGLSCVDFMAAADNETGVFKPYDNDEWYDVRLRVTESNISVWVDSEQVIDLDTFERNISPYFGLEMFAPFGIFTYQTDAAFRDIYIRRLGENSK